MSKIDHFEKNVAFPLAIRHGEGNTEYKKREKEGNNVTNNTEICFVK
jgi:phosphoribosylformylglycinamidine (FGAM) synthase-like amidotransferase family enzyme